MHKICGFPEDTVQLLLVVCNIVAINFWSGDDMFESPTYYYVYDVRDDICADQTRGQPRLTFANQVSLKSREIRYYGLCNVKYSSFHRQFFQVFKIPKTSATTRQKVVALQVGN